MSPPIYTPDGSEVSEIVLPDGSTASQVIGPDGNVVFEAAPDIPDSVVARPADDGTATNEDRLFGLQIETSQAWAEFQAEISSNTVGASTAYIYRVSDSALMDQIDISGSSPGDVVTFSDAGLSENTVYNVVLDNGGGSYDSGFYGNAAYPYTSSDGNLKIINGGLNTDLTQGGAAAFVRVGNITQGV